MKMYGTVSSAAVGSVGETRAITDWGDDDA